MVQVVLATQWLVQRQLVLALHCPLGSQSRPLAVG